MIDALAMLFPGVIEVVCVMTMVLVGASILLGALSMPADHDVTDDWERRNLGRGRGR